MFQKTVPPILLVTVLFASSQAPAKNPRSSVYDRLHQSIIEHAKADGDTALKRHEYQAAFVQLNGHGPEEAVILIDGPGYCGSGGCNIEVYRELANGQFRLVSKHTLCRDEVYVSSNDHYGWRDLVIHVSGGGAAAGKRTLIHNGNAYPLNPSVQPDFKGDASKLTRLEFVRSQ